MQELTSQGSRRGGMVNAMSVDVEDYFHVSAFESHIDPRQWSGYECRIPRNMDRILHLFDSAQVTATFFFLGWVVEKYPSLLRQVASAGHEIASHGYSHVQVCNQDEASFRQDVIRTKKLLEDTAGVAVNGYRAASFSIGRDTPWARDVLRNAGHTYSSSIFPIRHDRYGLREAPRFPFIDPDSGLLEIPVSTFELAGARLPCGGGGYFRLLPYWWSKLGIRRVNSVDGQPANFYFHPWEIDPDQPRVDIRDRRARFRHYVNLDRFERKLARLTEEFGWATISKAYDGVVPV